MFLSLVQTNQALTPVWWACLKPNELWSINLNSNRIWRYSYRPEQLLLTAHSQGNISTLWLHSPAAVWETYAKMKQPKNKLKKSKNMLFFLLCLGIQPSSNTRRSAGGNAIIETVLERRLVKINCPSKCNVLTSHWTNKIEVGPVRNSANHQAPLNARFSGKKARARSARGAPLLYISTKLPLMWSEEKPTKLWYLKSKFLTNYTEHCSNCLKNKK